MSHVVRMELPATHGAVRLARHMLTHFARLRGLDDRERDTLALVVSELLSNAVDHGGGEAAMDESQLLNGATMRMSLWIGRKQWKLQVSDQGGGDPAQLRGALADSDLPDLEDDRGRGLFLLRTSVDRLEVDPSEDGRGIRVTAVRTHGSR